jgi:hypothetical protein
MCIVGFAIGSHAALQLPAQIFCAASVRRHLCHPHVEKV